MKKLMAMTMAVVMVIVMLGTNTNVYARKYTFNPTEYRSMNECFRAYARFGQEKYEDYSRLYGEWFENSSDDPYDSMYSCPIIVLQDWDGNPVGRIIYNGGFARFNDFLNNMHLAYWRMEMILIP